MLRKWLLSLLCVLPICAWAWCPGFYLGAGLGADSTEYFENAIIQGSNTTGPFNAVNKVDLSAQGVLGSIFGGYGISRGMYYLAGELNGDLSSAEFKTSNIEFVHNVVSQTTFKIDQSWGVSILPGILLPETTLLYVRVGYAGGNFKINTSDTSLANANTMLNGFRAGVGIEKRIYRNFGIIFDYSHIDYSHYNIFTRDPVSGVTKRTTVSPDANQFEFGIDYRFC